MVRRVHSKLQRGQRASDENKNRCSHLFMGYNWRLNHFLFESTFAAFASFADATNHVSNCNCSYYSYSKTANIQETRGVITKKNMERGDALTDDYTQNLYDNSWNKRGIIGSSSWEQVLNRSKFFKGNSLHWFLCVGSGWSLGNWRFYLLQYWFSEARGLCLTNILVNPTCG